MKGLFLPPVPNYGMTSHCTWDKPLHCPFFFLNLPFFFIPRISTQHQSWAEFNVFCFYLFIFVLCYCIILMFYYVQFSYVQFLLPIMSKVMPANVSMTRLNCWVKSHPEWQTKRRHLKTIQYALWYFRFDLMHSHLWSQNRFFHPNEVLLHPNKLAKKKLKKRKTGLANQKHETRNCWKWPNINNSRPILKLRYYK